MNIIRNRAGAGATRDAGTRPRTSRRPRRAEFGRSSRRGVALLLVMVAVSASLIITLAFIRTQTSCIRIRQNSTRRDIALQAAHTGASVALQSMHSPDWAGVDVPIARTILADAEGTSSFEVEYLPIESTNPEVMPIDAPLYVVVQSTGRWVSAADPTEQVSRQVQVIAKLLPRVPGRTINDGDSAVASDVAPNPDGYDEIQTFAAYHRTTSTAPLLEPCSRIDGNISLAHQPSIYNGAGWTSFRDTVLDAIGSQFGTTTGGPSIVHPHPINGQICFRMTPTAAVQSALARMGVPWIQDGSSPTWPAIDYASRQTYKVFQGGFTYTAGSIGATPVNITLQPTATNPLGIFYRDGSVNLLEGCNIRGTIVATGMVTVTGRWVHLAAINWLDDSGAAKSWNSDKWPRLPAIVAANCTINRDTMSTVTGAIVCESTMAVFGNHFDYAAVADVDISGTATSWPVNQPKSIVQLAGSPDLSGINTSGNYSIWLENGSTGSWHEILGIDNTLKQLTVIGEVTHNSPVNFRIRRTRKAFCDVQGPVSCASIQMQLPLIWRNTSITPTHWNDIYTAWTALNADRAAQMLPPIPFFDYIADPANWAGFSAPMSTIGLHIEPHFHLRNTTGIQYRWNCPLFSPYNGTGENAPYAGYRWKVLSWRELS